MAPWHQAPGVNTEGGLQASPHVPTRLPKRQQRRCNSSRGGATAVPLRRRKKPAKEKERPSTGSTRRGMRRRLSRVVAVVVCGAGLCTLRACDGSVRHGAQGTRRLGPVAWQSKAAGGSGAAGVRGRHGSSHRRRGSGEGSEGGEGTEAARHHATDRRTHPCR